MKTLTEKIFVLISLIVCLCANPCLLNAALSGNDDEKNRIRSTLQALTIPFIENTGQSPAEVRYYAPTFGGTLFVTTEGEMVYSLPVKDGDKTGNLIVREKLAGGMARSLKGEQKAAVRVNIFKGEDPARWRTGVAAYEFLSMGEVWGGIELKLKARGKNVEKLFHVRNGADPGLIRVVVEGAETLHVNEAGELVLLTKQGNVIFTRPAAYQMIDGRKHSVPVRYEVAGNTYGFILGAYDGQKELIIDPLLSTYLGGSNAEHAMAIATNVIMGKRYIYVAGSTTSHDFPGMAMYQLSPGYNQDAFIALIDMDLTAVQFTYLGGSGEDMIYDMAVRQPDGAVFVVGTTDGHFPVTFYSTRGGDKDAFVAKLSWDLATLEKSRYFGGALADYGVGIALYDDPTGDPAAESVYITGQTKSSDLPGTEYGAQPAKSGGTSYSDAFAARFSMDLSLKRATYLGGPSIDVGYDIAVHPEEPHDVYVVGDTSYCPSNEPYPDNMLVGCFPWTGGGGIPSFVGSKDVFVVRLSADLRGTPAPQATYYGGTGLDRGAAIAIHPGTGNVYIAGGRTNEPLLSPTDQYAFVAYFNPELTAYLGDAHIGETARKQTDRAQDIRIVSGVGIYVLGWTGSNDLAGTEDGILPTYRGGYADLFVARFHNDLTLDQATYLGGSAQEEVFGQGLAVAEDPSSPGEDWHVFVAGDIYGSGLAGVSDGTAFQPDFNKGSDILIARMNADLKPDAIPDIEVQPRMVDFGNVVLNTDSAAKTVTIENIGGTALSVSSVAITGAGAGDFTLNTAPAASPCGSFPRDISGSSNCSLALVFRPTVINQWRDAELVIQTTNDPDEPAVRVRLRGYSGPEIAVTSPVYFPTTQMGSTTTKIFQIKNVGVSTLTLSAIQKAGIAPGTGEDFTLLYGTGTSPCPSAGPFTLLSGAFCNVPVQFSPATSGKQEAVAIIFSDDLDENPAFVNLVGEGVTHLDCDIWSHDLEFRDTPVGNSRALPLLITNTGSKTLNITGITLSDTTNFSYDPGGGAIPCGPAAPFSLAKVSSCTMMVTFKPTYAGAFDKTMTVVSNDPDDGSFVIHLTGSSVADSDHDGVPDAEESGDANGDGIPDAQQPRVASLRSFDDLHTVVIESQTAGSSLDAVQAVNPPGGSLPGSLGEPTFPFGFYHFKVILPAGVDTATIVITLPAGETAETHIKWGPEADNVEPHYYDFGNEARYPGRVSIAGNVITLRLTDNGPGDHDGALNGQIYDPGAPARLVKGDLDRNGMVNLSDAILCMRVLTNLKTTASVRKQADVNADGVIGAQEIIYILQKIAGLR